jgi:predicted Rossmann fold nucleotide-binding protein DprA/Smf involved in DNA uptake
LISPYDKINSKESTITSQLIKEISEDINKYDNLLDKSINNIIDKTYASNQMSSNFEMTFSNLEGSKLIETINKKEQIIANNKGINEDNI